MHKIQVRFLWFLAVALILRVPGRSSSPTYAVGAYPKFIISADLNKDGFNDVITANYHASSISILLGNGDGTFRPEVSYTVGQYPTGLASGDFNGDGILDLAVANAINPHGTSCPSCGLQGVSILLGNGDGTFRQSAFYAAASGTAWVSVADMNGDGKLDIIAAAWEASAVSVLLGNGDGTFQAPLSHVVGAVPHSIAIADFDGDGILDLAVGNMNSSNVEILIGKGNGTFKTGASYPVGEMPHSICQGDFNHDGKVDLATGNMNSGSITVLLGNGDGTFQPGVSYVTGAGTTSIFPGDFNGDGILDLATANYGTAADGPANRSNTSSGPSSVSILLGNADGTFQPAVNYSTGSGGNGVVAAYLNQDDHLDLAVCFFANYVSVLLGSAGGVF